MQLADVIVVVMGDQHWIDAGERYVQRGELAHHAAAGVDQNGGVGSFNQQRSGAAGCVRARAAGAKEGDGGVMGYCRKGGWMASSYVIA